MNPHSENSLPDCIVFDLDSTLAKSKQPIENQMATMLTKIVEQTKIAVTSGGKLEQLLKQVVDQLPKDANISNVFLLPTSGAALYTYKNEKWTCLYEETLSPKEVEEIGNAIRIANDKTNTVDFSQKAYGKRIEFRGAQVSFSALGQEAPLDEKLSWDPTRAKRSSLRNALAPILTEYTVRIGGKTTIDITKHGIDKAYGIRKLSEYLAIPIEKMRYVGDELGEGGNDEVVIQTGIPTRAVTNPDDTLHYLETLIKKT
ncbi:MAG TPA: HAD-IIB family hydrolase [Candidatus Kaiserbacteria bacterium]|nr:HAD-IIB family hydrolase [Candidatus Kaiserbacteria bacterium]